MKIEPRCYPCQIKRVLSELKLCNLESEKELEIAQKMVGFYGTTKERRSSWLGTSARSLLANLTGIQDPYEELKRQANEFAIEELEKFREFLDAISDPFERFEKA